MFIWIQKRNPKRNQNQYALKRKHGNNPRNVEINRCHQILIDTNDEIEQNEKIIRNVWEPNERKCASAHHPPNNLKTCNLTDPWQRTNMKHTMQNKSLCLSNQICKEHELNNDTNDFITPNVAFNDGPINIHPTPTKPINPPRWGRGGRNLHVWNVNGIDIQIHNVYEPNDYRFVDDSPANNWLIQTKFGNKHTNGKSKCVSNITRFNN